MKLVKEKASRISYFILLFLISAIGNPLCIFLINGFLNVIESVNKNIDLESKFFYGNDLNAEIYIIPYISFSIIFYIILNVLSFCFFKFFGQSKVTTNKSFIINKDKEITFIEYINPRMKCGLILKIFMVFVVFSKSVLFIVIVGAVLVFILLVMLCFFNDNMKRLTSRNTKDAYE